MKNERKRLILFWLSFYSLEGAWKVLGNVKINKLSFKTFCVWILCGRVKSFESRKFQGGSATKDDDPSPPPPPSPSPLQTPVPFPCRRKRIFQALLSKQTLPNLMLAAGAVTGEIKELLHSLSHYLRL